MKSVLITGVTGTLGVALARHYHERGWRVRGVTRQAGYQAAYLDTVIVNAQETLDDARHLLAFDADLIVLNAGQIETDVGPHGLPLHEIAERIYLINFLFPARLGLEAAHQPRTRRLDVVTVGSIADGSPSCFGPVYHVSKIAAHYFVSGVGPIAQNANPNVRLRLYRPGVIKGPLSWAPTNRLNAKAYGIRARRCAGAPDPAIVAASMARWMDGDGWVGTYKEPWSFRIFKFWFALAPDAFYRLQNLGWRRGSKWGPQPG